MLGISGFFLQVLLTAGLRYEKSSRATNMVYSQMLFALGADRVIWGTVPGGWSLGGSALILGAAVVVAVQKEGVVAGKEGGEGWKERGRGGGDEEAALVEGLEMVEADAGEENSTRASLHEDEEESRRLMGDRGD